MGGGQGYGDGWVGGWVVGAPSVKLKFQKSFNVFEDIDSTFKISKSCSGGSRAFFGTRDSHNFLIFKIRMFRNICVVFFLIKSVIWWLQSQESWVYEALDM